MAPNCLSQLQVALSSLNEPRIYLETARMQGLGASKMYTLFDAMFKAGCCLARVLRLASFPLKEVTQDYCSRRLEVSLKEA